MSNGPTPNLVPHAPRLSRAQRESLLGLRGCTIWLTGLSGSGKSTIAAALELELIQRGRPAYRLDGDNLRMGLCANLGFSPDDRAENVRRVGCACRLFADAGIITIASLISPYRLDRDAVRAMHERDPDGPLPFLEVFVDAPLTVCESRDPKGLYKKARAGQIPGFTGIDDPYEPPLRPDLVVNTATMTPEACVAACLALLERHATPTTPARATVQT